MSYIGKQPRKAALTSSDIEDGIITAAKIEDGAVVAAEIASNAVTTAKINADAVTGAKIADDAINSEHYTDGSIDTAHIAADQITNAKIADDQIDSEHYVDGSIDTAHIAADQITNAKIADDQIDSEHYVDGSIDTAHIANVNVTQAKIADQAINEAKMQISNGPTNGYMLTAQSGNTGGMTWAEAGGGSWNLLSTTLADDSARIDCTLSGSYQNFAIIIDGLHPASDNVQLQARMSTASTTSDGGSNYRYISATSQDAGATNTYYSTGETFIKVVGDSLGNASGESLEATIFIGDPTWTEHSTRLNILSVHTDNAGRTTTNNAGGTYNPTTAVTKINFLLSSGNIQYGVFKVYGIS